MGTIQPNSISVTLHVQDAAVGVGSDPKVDLDPVSLKQFQAELLIRVPVQIVACVCGVARQIFVFVGTHTWKRKSLRDISQSFDSEFGRK